ncbi:MAG TPA: exonuclease domain-containing protein [Candidatus Faecousia gallistercoris]|nr:exonuclease domain-containing protein [Candidatus Faecousia gallistercoris]
MDYIILDMEWNQPWPGSPTAKKPLPVQIRGEIIQIGAVRILEDQTVADEFQIMVKPKFYRHLNKRVSKLTGIKEAQLKAEGLPFPEAVERFRTWCGTDVIFLTWGFDDIAILQENLALFALPAEWTSRWYNAQMMFNAQTDGSNAQKALKTAMELFQISPSRPAHDALGDAYHTALICARLDLARGIREYNEALQEHENGFHGAELPGCLTRQVYAGLAGKEEALAQMAGPDNLCPTCGAQMTCRRWFSQPGRRYMALAQCPEHGDFLVRIRLSPAEDGTLRVSRLTYRGDSEAAQAYAKRAEKAEAARPSRRRRRRRCAKKASVSSAVRSAPEA